MIPKYINDWCQIIEQMKTDNTYKLAWGRALIEYICLEKYTFDNNKVIISFDSISECMLKYYWNQIFYFNLKQAPYKDKEVVVCKYVKILIDEYKMIQQTKIPTWYDQGIKVIRKENEDLYNVMLKKISKTLTFDVCYRFKNVVNEVLEIYECDKKKQKIIFNFSYAMLLKEYGVIITKIINFKWAQLLEAYNYVPKIASKVSSISETKIKRKNLSKYKDQLLKEYNGKPIDFYTGEELNVNDISVDHVIPWSFMYSDDIWNLVITSKSENSTKNNSIPTSNIIKKLKARNESLINVVDEKYKLSLEEAIDNNYLDKFYYECRL